MTAPLLIHAAVIVGTTLTGVVAFVAFVVLVVLAAALIVHFAEHLIAVAFVIGVPIGAVFMCYRLGAWVLSGFKGPLL